MKDDHAQILRKQRMELAKFITDVASVVESLFSEDVITENMKDMILCQSSKRERVFELLNILPRREDEAFEEFYKILVEHDEGKAADLLKPKLKHQRKSRRKSERQKPVQESEPNVQEVTNIFEQAKISEISTDDDNLPDDLHIETMSSESPNNEIRIVILGKSRVGKSSLGNNLVQRRSFLTGFAGTSITSICQFAQVKRNDGSALCVVDTPGLFDTRKSNQETMTEIVRCIGLSSPGPHVFFFVLRIGRFTKEDLDTVDHLVAVFGETVVRHVVVIFTGKDSLEYDEITLSDYLNDKSIPRELNLLLQRCHSRCAAINNRAPDTQADIDAIINLVNKTIQENGGNYYTGEIYLAAEEALKEKMTSMDEEGRKKERQHAEREQKEMAEGKLQETEKLKTGLGEHTNSDSRRIIRELLAASDEIVKSLFNAVRPIMATALDKLAQMRCTIS